MQYYVVDSRYGTFKAIRKNLSARYLEVKNENNHQRQKNI